MTNIDENATEHIIENQTLDSLNDIDHQDILTPEPIETLWSNAGGDHNSKVLELQAQIEKLTKDLSQSQRSYFELYNNYKIIEKQLEDFKSNQKNDRLFFGLKEFSPIINNLYNFINTLSPELSSNDSVKWLTMWYDNYIKSLESRNIYIVKSLGEMPNEMHDIVAMQDPTQYDIKSLSTHWIDTTNLSGKIINQFEVWFYYDDLSKKEIIKSAKVIVWA